MGVKTNGKKPRLDGGAIVIKYLGEYPAWFPNSALARIIYAENPEGFKNVEDARFMIRYHTGSAGDKNRAIIARGNHVSLSQIEKKSSVRYEMPKSWSDEKRIYELPSALKRVGFICDAQHPFHDEKAIDVAFDFLVKHSIDSLLINGDWGDFYQFSDFEKDPAYRDPRAEYEIWIESLLYIKQCFPNIPVYYNLDANHEARYGRYMRTKAPELLNLKLFEIEDLLRLNEIGIIPIRDYHHVKIGKLPCIHGDTVFRRGSGAYPAKKLFDKLKSSCIASHVHRTSEYSGKNNITGDISTCWTVGMLAHPNMEYCKHMDEYNQGVAIIHKEIGGDYEVENRRILNYKIR